ncbi:MAG: VOC family protein [Candidimonas sp.]|jgi:hypothetical protein
MDSARRTTIGLDHVGLFSSSLESVATQYERLGFCLTPTSQHASPPAPGEPAVLRGTANRCAMLDEGYIELLAVVDRALDTLGVPEALAKYEGMHILAFETQDPRGEQARLREAGYDSVNLAYLQRVLQTEQGEALARFVQVRTPPQAMPEGRVFMLQHPTRDLVWQPRYLTHPNTAVKLAEIIVAVDDLAEAGARYARYLACPARRQAGRASFDLRQGRFTLMERPALERAYPGVSVPQLPFPAVLVVGVQNVQTTERLLVDNRIPFERQQGGLVVEASSAGGVALVFSQAG